jgi:hypothetical protein
MTITSEKLLVKPLRCHLIGLLNKLDPFDGDKISQSVIDCSNFLLIELDRIDGVRP